MSDNTSVSVRFDALSEEPINVRNLIVTEGTPIPIGRASNCETKGLIAGPNNAFFHCAVVSRRHAELSVLPNEKARFGYSIYVTDVGSMHGTFLNDLKLPKGDKHELSDGDILKLGNLVQRDDDDYRPLDFAVKLRFNISGPSSKTDKRANTSFKTPGYSSDEYDVSEVEDSESDALPSSIIQPLSPYPDSPNSSLVVQDSAINDHVDKENNVKDVACPKANEPQGHKESNVPDTFDYYSNSDDDANSYQSHITSDGSVSPVESAISDDDVYSSFAQSSKLGDEDEDDFDEHLDLCDGETHSTDRKEPHFRPLTGDKKQEVIAPSRNQASDMKARAFPDSATMSTASLPTSFGYGPANPPNYWASQYPGSRMSDVPPFCVPPGPTARPSPGSHTPNQYTPINPLFSLTAPIPYNPSGVYFDRGSRYSELVDPAEGTGPLNPPAYASTFGLDSNASLAPAPYQANRFDPNAYQWNGLSPVGKNDGNKQAKEAPSSQTLWREASFQASESSQSSKDGESAPQAPDAWTTENFRQPDEGLQHSGHNSQQKSALRICDLVDSLGAKDNKVIIPLGAAKRKFVSAADASGVSGASAEPSSQDLKPTTPTKSHQYDLSPPSHHVYTQETLGDGVDEDLDELDDFNDTNDFDGVDENEVTEPASSCIADDAPLAQARQGNMNEKKEERGELSSAQATQDNIKKMEERVQLLFGQAKQDYIKKNEERAGLLPTRANASHPPAEPAQEGPLRKKVKLDAPATTPALPVSRMPRKSKANYAATAMSAFAAGFAVGGVFIATALANLPDSMIP